MLRDLRPASEGVFPTDARLLHSPGKNAVRRPRTPVLQAFAQFPSELVGNWILLHHTLFCNGLRLCARSGSKRGGRPSILAKMRAGLWLRSGGKLVGSVRRASGGLVGGKAVEDSREERFGESGLVGRERARHEGVEFGGDAFGHGDERPALFGKPQVDDT